MSNNIDWPVLAARIKNSKNDLIVEIRLDEKDGHLYGFKMPASSANGSNVDVLVRGTINALYRLVPSYDLYVQNREMKKSDLYATYMNARTNLSLQYPAAARDL